MKKTFAIDCPDHGYIRLDELGLEGVMSSCPKCAFGKDYNLTITSYKSHNVEVDGQTIHVGSKKQEKMLEKTHGIARYEEIKERAKDAKNRKPEYKLSPEAQKMVNYIKSNGVSERLVKHLPSYKSLKRPVIVLK